MKERHEKEASGLKERYETQISDLQKDNSRLQRRLERLRPKDGNTKEKKKTIQQLSTQWAHSKQMKRKERKTNLPR